jgi:hypothetical protein
MSEITIIYGIIGLITATAIINVSWDMPDLKGISILGKICVIVIIAIPSFFLWPFWAGIYLSAKVTKNWRKRNE